MKAWKLLDNDGSGCVVWAETRGRAQAMLASAFDCSFTEVGSVRRAPEFDGEKHRITRREYVEKGWWVYCERCYKKGVALDDDEPPYADERGDVYCNACGPTVAGAVPIKGGGRK